MNYETIFVALIVSVIAPAVLAVITNRQRRMEKQEEYSRQNEIALRVASVAAAQLESTELVGKKIATVAAAQLESTELVGKKIATAAAAQLESTQIVGQKIATAAAAQLESAEKVAEATGSTASKLEQVHILANSNVTVLMQAELAGLMREKSLISAMKRMAPKGKADPKLDVLMKIADGRVSELHKALAERSGQAQLAEGVALTVRA